MTFARRIATAALTLAVVALAGLMLVPILLGYERYVITTGSMTGTYDPGSIVYDKVVPVDQLRVGDAITYAPPSGATDARILTHRIVSIRTTAEGRKVFRTKGDANQSADPWKFQLVQPTQARVDFSVPYAGRVILALADRQTRMLLIGGPALLIALLVLLRTVEDARSAGRARRSAPTAAAAL